MNRASSLRSQDAGALIISMIVIAALVLVAAHTLRHVEPKLRMAYQTAAWQEARLAAEAGVDVAMSELSRNALQSSTGGWTGWKQSENGIVVPALASTLSLVTSLLSLPGNSTKISQPIFLDNLQVSSGAALDTAVDVQLWAVYPNGSPNGRWFRIRAMATCALPPPAYTAPDSLDTPLRRYSLRTVRAQLRKDDVGVPTSIHTPSASRTVEVLVEPILPFELAILTDQTLSLGTSGAWGVDSYDSRDPKKSNPDGSYPGRDSGLAQAQGNIACNGGRPANALYGPLISANGAQVRGSVATNGGDDPSTPDHENVAGAIAIDPTRVNNDFYRELPPPVRPPAGVLLPPPLLGIPFTAGTDAAPTQYLVGGNLGAFSVAAPPAGTTGTVLIFVNGDLDVPSGEIQIPPNVTAQIYVSGDIDFHQSAINTGTASSRHPAQLQIYGQDSQGQKRTLQALGVATVCAAFYGPQYQVSLADNVDWCGSITGKSFEMLGGGTGGVHYDEALGAVGVPIGFRIVRYVEDVRE